MFSKERKTCMNTKILVLLVIALAAVPAMAEVVSQDNFDDGDLAGWTNTGNVWVNTDGKAVFPLGTKSPADYYSLYTTFDNVQPENGAFKFTGEFRFLNDTYMANQNSFRVCLLDAAGLNGYTIRRALKQDDSYGMLRLLKVTNGTETVLASLNPVVYAATGTWELSRDQEGLITVRINRANSEQFDLITVTDTSFNNFGRVELKEYYYESGTPVGFSFDNIKFETVPEPATMVLTIMGGAFMLKRRK